MYDAMPCLITSDFSPSILSLSWDCPMACSLLVDEFPTTQQQQQQHSLSVPNKLSYARVETHQEPQVTVQTLQ